MINKHSTLGLSLTVFFRIIVIKLFCVLLDFTVMIALGGRVGYIITQICSLALLVFIMYSTLWERGFGDVNRAKLGTMKADKYRGFKAGLIGSSAEIISAVCLILSKFSVFPRSLVSFFGLFNSPFLPLHITFLPATLTINELSIFNFIISASTVLLVPIICGFAYLLGSFELSLPEIFIYTTPEARKVYKQKKHAKLNKGYSKIFKQ